MSTSDPPPKVSSDRATGLVELIDKALDSWSRTLRLVMLTIAPMLSVVSVTFVVRLDLAGLASVLAAAGSVIGGVALLRRRADRRAPPSRDGPDPP